MLRVASLHIYPVKACAGVDLPVMELDDRGPIHDRRFMIVDESGRFITQREAPRMALIRPSIRSTGLLLETAGVAPLQVDSGAARRHVQVWSSELEAIDVGDAAAQWLSVLLDRSVRLVSMAPDVRRPIDAPHNEGPISVAFADGFPLLVTHASSLRELNGRLEQPITMDRFRANIVIDGGAPWEEDTWKSLRIGDATIRLPKPCERCTVITVDPTTGESGKEPLKTLATYRRVTGAGVIFGQNGILWKMLG